MAIVLEKSCGWIVEEERWYNSGYEPLGFRIQPALYQIEEPFRMDSQVEAINRRKQQSATISNESQATTESTNTDSSGRRRRKRHRVPDEDGTDEFMATIRRNFDELVAAGRKSDTFKESLKPDVSLTNNRRAREAAKTADTKAAFPDIRQLSVSSSSTDRTRPLELQHGSEYAIGDLLKRTCVNGSERPVSFRLEDRSYVVPAKSRFAWGDVAEELNRIIEANSDHYFDLVIMDPPWRNKSVKRQKTYRSQDESGLEDLPIPKLLKPGALVIIWVTNNPQYHEYLTDTLLPEWGLTLEARWFWFKVTTSGEPVCGYRKDFKMPFETVIFGRYPSSAPADMVKVPDGKIIISVPSALPSRKPPLLEILKSLGLADSLSCLELYARYLLPGTFSVGDQVVKFQNQEYYELDVKNGCQYP